MPNLYQKVKDYEYGKISKRAVIQHLIEELKIVNRERPQGDIEKFSYCESAHEGIKKLISDLSSKKEEKDNLRFYALVCDISNNLAHSCVEGSHIHRELRGVKKTLAFDIVKECDRIGNKSYGILEDRGILAFAVDIPGIGQVKWHFPNHCEIRSKQYDFEIERGESNITNMNLLCQKIPAEKLGKHNLLVINSNSVEEMNEKLYPKSKFEDTLKALNNSEKEISHYYKKEYEPPKIEIVHPEESDLGGNKILY